MLRGLGFGYSEEQLEEGYALMDSPWWPKAMDFYSIFAHLDGGSILDPLRVREEIVFKSAEQEAAALEDEGARVEMLLSEQKEDGGRKEEAIEEARAIWAWYDRSGAEKLGSKELTAMLTGLAVDGEKIRDLQARVQGGCDIHFFTHWWVMLRTGEEIPTEDDQDVELLLRSDRGRSNNVRSGLIEFDDDDDEFEEIKGQTMEELEQELLSLREDKIAYALAQIREDGSRNQSQKIMMGADKPLLHALLTVGPRSSS